MRRLMWAAILLGLAMAGPAMAQPAGGVESLRERGSLTDQDRKVIGEWLDGAIKALATSTDPERRTMVAARENIVAECRKEGARSDAYVQAVGEEAIKRLAAAQAKVTAPDARLNLLMTVAELRRLEGVPVLQSTLEKDPAPAMRYWAAKGLAQVAEVVVEKSATRTEAAIADSIAKVVDSETATVTLLQMFDTLAKFDHERAFDVMTAATIKVAQRTGATDPIAAQMFDHIIRGLQGAFSRETRPEGKTRILMAYATLCTWLMPPTADAGLLTTLNSSLEQVTGEKVGFSATDDPTMQKLALLEWVEKFIKAKKIAKRPPAPPAVDAAVKQLQEAGGAVPATP